MPDTPAITVALPVYNGESTITECLDALAAQTCDSFVVQIFDNASTDATGTICEARAKTDPRFVYHRNPTNVGSAQNYIDALMAAETPYFLWRADDDLCDEHFLERLKDQLDSNPHAALAGCHVEARRAGRTKVREFRYLGTMSGPRIFSILRQMFFLHQSTIYGVWRTEALVKYYMSTWEKYPHGWGNDHLVMLGVILDEALVGDDSVRFIQRIGVRHAEPTPQKSERASLEERIAFRETMLPVYRSVCREMVAARSWTRFERALMSLLITQYANKRLNGSDFQILRLKIRKALRDLFQRPTAES